MSIATDYPGLRFYWDQIVATATKHSLDPFLVAAIVLQESSANTDAFRHERLFWNRYLKPKPEWASLNPRRVSSSYGLMQVMYPVAVERGLAKDVPPETLFAPEVGLEYGCRHLAYMQDRMSTKCPDVPIQIALKATIASYNGGFQTPDALRPDNRRYAESVIAIYARLKTDAKSA